MSHQGLFRYTSAGHPGPVPIRNVEPSMAQDPGGFPIGVTADANYQEHTIPLQKDDRLFLYSDGLVELQNAADELFGKQRLLDLVATDQTATLEESVRRLEQHAVSWSGKRSLDDDLSILACEINTVGQ